MPLWKKSLVALASAFGIIVVGAGVAFGVYSWNNLHWYDAYENALEEADAQERQATTPRGTVINYGEVANDKPALLLIHGQMGQWEDYATVLPELSERWHVYAVDVYGHGQSTHEESLYYLDVNGDDLIWFIDNVIGQPTVIAGHSNGALTAAYVAAYGHGNVVGCLMEDPPVFSTQGEGWQESFAYLDTYQPLHNYLLTDRSECWEAYYLRHCHWGQLFMKDSMPGIASYAQHYADEHPGEYVKIFFLPSSVWSVFKYAQDYDFAYGEHFYDLTWNNGYTHEQILSDIDVPCVYLHAQESVGEDGTYLCAASREQAERAVALIGADCTLVETDTSDHVIHVAHRETYLDALNSLASEQEG